MLKALSLSLCNIEVISFTLSQHRFFQFGFRPWTSRIRIFQMCRWSILCSANAGSNQNINQVVRRHFNHVRPPWTKAGHFLQLISAHILYSFPSTAHLLTLCFKFENSVSIILHWLQDQILIWKCSVMLSISVPMMVDTGESKCLTRYLDLHIFSLYPCSNLH